MHLRSAPLLLLIAAFRNCVAVLIASLILTLSAVAQAPEGTVPVAPNLAPVPNESNAEPPAVGPETIPGAHLQTAPESTSMPTPVVTATPGPTPAAAALPTEATAKPGTPIYMRRREPMKIFDPGKGEELSPLQAAAQRLAEQRKQVARRNLSNVQHLITMEYALTGASEGTIIEEAQTQALVSAAARLYFENYMLLGRDLLEPYLRENGRPFVARTEVFNQHIVSAHSVGMSVRVSVNLDTLFQDLNEKHFIAKPSLRPPVSVHLHELVDGEPNTGAGARTRIEQIMNQNLFRVFSRRMRQPGLDVDLSTDAEILKTARFEAQRNGADVLITGTLAIHGVEQKPILYDPYSFQEASAVLKMYRVDTGELLAEVRDSYSANGETETLATRNVLDALLTRMSQQLADRLRELWGPMMLDEANYRLMVAGVAPEKVSTVFNMIKSLDPDLHVYQKAYYGDVLVVNVELPNERREKFLSLLRESVEPQFVVNPVDKHRISLELL